MITLFQQSARFTQGGYIALVSVLIASALIVLIGVGSSLRGVDTLNGVSGEESSFRAELLADACAEEALMKLKSNLAYSGNETIIVNGGATCMITSVTGAGNNDRTVRTQASDNGYMRIVLVDVSRLNPGPVIRSWATVP